MGLPMGAPLGAPNRMSCQAQGQKVLQALVMAHPRTASLKARVLGPWILLLSSERLLPCWPCT